jgi:hypothetical protein
MTPLALAPASVPGIITSVASVLTAILVFITAIIGFIQVRRLRQGNAENGGKLDVIHTLVNSTLTAAVESELDSVQQALASIIELVKIQRASGEEPAPETLAAIDAARIKIAHLQQQLADRLVAAQRVIDQVAAQRTQRIGPPQ